MKFLSLLAFLLISSTAWADVASLDANFVAGQTQITDQLNRDRTTLTNSVNNIRGVYAGAVQSSGQIKAQTIGEENMASDSNPRYRTAEGASCNDFVYTGLLMGGSSSLIGSIPTGVAYPDGYRVEKTSSTAHSFTAQKWTYVYILSSGSFSYQEVNIGQVQPADPANSALLFKASTDTTTINTVTDQRVTNCTGGPFSDISDASGEASLGDLLSKGTVVRRISEAGRTPQGFATGSFVSWDTATTLKVTLGCLYLGGRYRCISSDLTVPTTVADASTGVSGMDTGTLAVSTKYYVYGMAEVASASTYSVSVSASASTPAGSSGYHRLIGSIKTDATSLITSRDLVTAHAISERELVSAWINYNSTAGTISRAFNVSGITDNGTGDFTIAWNKNFANAFYSATATASYTSTASPSIIQIKAMAVGSVQVTTEDQAGTARDCDMVSVSAIGDRLL